MGKKLTDGLTLKANGTYELVRRIDGKQKSFSSKDPRKVWEKYNAYLRATNEQREDLQKKKQFSSVADEWWNEKQNEIAYGSIRTYKTAKEKAVSQFGNSALEDLDAGQVDVWLKHLGQKYAYKTVSNCLSVVRMICDYAVLRHYIKINPCLSVRVPRNLRRTSRELLTDSQLAAIKGSVDNPDSLLAFLIMYTGARCGEALALQWKDIDFDAKEVHITKAVVHHGNTPIIDKTKTYASVRTIPLLSPLEAILKPLAGSPDDYLLGGKQPFGKSKLNRYWERYTKSIGLCVPKDGGDKWEPLIDRHQIRHEYATILYDAKIDLMVAQRWMGHTDIATTQKIYMHIRQRKMDEAKALVEKQLLDH